MKVFCVEDAMHDAKLAMAASRKSRPTNKHLCFRVSDESSGSLVLIGAHSEQGARLRLVIRDLSVTRIDGTPILAPSSARIVRRTAVVGASAAQARDVARCFDCAAKGYLGKSLGFTAAVAMVSQAGCHRLAINHQPLIV